MTPDLQQRANRVLTAALDRPTEQRGRFLDQACAGDAALRELVDSLLAHADAASREGFLAQPCPLNVRAQAIEARPVAIYVGPANTARAGETRAASPRPNAPAATAEPQPSIPGLEILGLLGQGGMGVVYKARQTGLNRLVALKMIRAGDLAGPEALARFRGEAAAVARLQHLNIVQIYEISERAA
jgi:hypothetical protein